MKWALIYLLGTSGIWDTGYRYSSYEDCAENKYGITVAIHSHIEKTMREEKDKMQTAYAMRCVLTKD